MQRTQPLAPLWACSRRISRVDPRARLSTFGAATAPAGASTARTDSSARQVSPSTKRYKNFRTAARRAIRGGHKPRSPAPVIRPPSSPAEASSRSRPPPRQEARAALGPCHRPSGCLGRRPLDGPSSSISGTLRPMMRRSALSAQSPSSASLRASASGPRRASSERHAVTRPARLRPPPRQVQERQQRGPSAHHFCFFCLSRRHPAPGRSPARLCPSPTVKAPIWFTRFRWW